MGHCNGGRQTEGGEWALPPVPLSQQQLSDTFQGMHARNPGSAQSISFCLILCPSPGISREAGDEAPGPEPLVNLTVRPRATGGPLAPVPRLCRAQPRPERTLLPTTPWHRTRCSVKWKEIFLPGSSAVLPKGK